MSGAPDPIVLARDAVAALADPGQALAVWERRLGSDGADPEKTRVTVTAVADGRAASADARTPDRDGVRRAARAAGLHARRMRALPAPPLPEPDGGGSGVGEADEAGLDDDAGGTGAGGAGGTDGADDAGTDDRDGGNLAAIDVSVREGAGPGMTVDWSAGVARVAVVSTTGIDVAERRPWAVVAVSATAADGRSARAGRVTAAPGPARLAELAAAAAGEVRALLGVAHVGHPLVDQRAEPAVGGPLVVAVPALREELPADGSVGVVLGPEAVAVVLEALRSDLGVGVALGDGPFAASAGTIVAAPLITLVEDPADPAGLPRAFDAEGVPRRRVPLIERGVLVGGGVRDSAAAARATASSDDTAAAPDGAAAPNDIAAAPPGAATPHDSTRSTGHATRPLTLAPSPEHLVLAPGDIADVATLCAALGDGVYLPTLATAFEPGEDGGRIHAAPGAARVRDGVPTGGLVDLHVAVEARVVLAATTSLTATARAVPLRGHCPGGIAAAVVPALLATDGVRVEHVDGP